MTEDRRSAIDLAMDEMVSSRASDLAFQLQGGATTKALREMLGSSTVASLFASEPDSTISRTIADMQMRSKLPSSAFALLRDDGGLLAESGRISASLALLQPLTESLAGVSEMLASDKLALRPEMLSMLSGVADAARFNQWAGVNGTAVLTRLAAMNGASSNLASEINRIQQTVAGAFTTMNGLDRLKLSSDLGIHTAGEALRAATQTRFAALAGAGDVLGFGADTSVRAYGEIFGNWHTRPDLPPRFWRDPALRRRRYEQAEVDRGLIEASPSEAVEIIIGSGLVAGAANDEAYIGLIDVGGVSMQIRSSNPAADAFKAIAQFERTFRTFISSKLAASAGPKWMKQRMDGPMFLKAKANRAKALGNGEREGDLLAYVDVGDLGGIVFRRDNWDQVFGHVFPSRERLTFDIETLVATRRPTMHARGIDAVRLVELLCVIRRLMQWMEDDGAWRIVADADE